MEKSMLFLRGQIWYWEDPVYGSKAEQNVVPTGEGVFRYSRYVLVVQTTVTIDNRSVLVVPCSSKNNDAGIEVPLQFLCNEERTYVRCRNVCPVSARQLKRYICTLSDETMARVDTELSKLLVPVVHVPTPAVEITPVQPDNVGDNDLFNRHAIILQHFIEQNLIYDPNAQVMFGRLKIEYDIVCSENHVEVISDMDMFKAFVIKCLRNLGWPVSTTQAQDSDELEEVFMAEKTSQQAPVNDVTPEPPKTPVPMQFEMDRQLDWGSKYRWDPEEMDLFIKTCEEKGVATAASQWGLQPSTAKSYRNKFKRRLLASSNSVTENDHTELDPNLPNTTGIVQTVSRISNMIRNYLIHDENVYTTVSTKLDKSVGTRYNETDFCQKMGSCIYYSLLDLLGIHQQGFSNYDIPQPTLDDPVIQTWWFMDRVWNDPRIPLDRDARTLIETYHQWYGARSGIDIAWMDLFRVRLMTKLEVNSDAMKYIAALTKTMFCEKNGIEDKIVLP